MLTICFSQITILLKNALISLEKLSSRDLYFPLVYTHPFIPTSQKCLASYLQIYLLPRFVTLDSCSLSFQYKPLNNVFYLNKKLITFRKSTSPLYSYCKLFWWDCAPSILRMRFNSKFMEWPILSNATGGRSGQKEFSLAFFISFH